MTQSPDTRPEVRTVVLALGGNAMVVEGEDGSLVRQQERARDFAEIVCDLVADGWRVIVTHGNGPQVGFIARRGELIADLRLGEGLPEL
ncbi:MAG TPA: hypothetical protein VLQ67_08215, partial [Arachnia sp.]|nr:hypothetical protein [Arachnia sp.]